MIHILSAIFWIGGMFSTAAGLVPVPEHNKSGELAGTFEILRAVKFMNSDKRTERSEMEMARKIRDACMDAAKEGFHQAAMSGLCMEGAVEAAVGAIQSLDLEKFMSGKRSPGA